MSKIKFSRNFNNKLELGIFPTIRKYAPEKFDYFMQQMLRGIVQDIILDGVKCTEASIIAVQHFQQLKDVPLPLLLIDTGTICEADAYAVLAEFGILPEDPVIALACRRTKLFSVQLPPPPEIVQSHVC